LLIRLIETSETSETRELKELMFDDIAFERALDRVAASKKLTKAALLGVYDKSRMPGRTPLAENVRSIRDALNKADHDLPDPAARAISQFVGHGPGKVDQLRNHPESAGHVDMTGKFLGRRG